MINIQPTLTGKILKLRPLRLQDFQLLYKAASDKLIWEQHPQPLRYKRDVFQNGFFKTAIQSKGALVVQNLNDQIIGCTRYYTYRPQNKDIAIGYTFLTRDYWGQKPNREMKHLMMSHIYDWIDTIFFSVGANNKRSRRAVEKIGGQLLSTEQQLERNYVVPGSVIYQIKKQDFKGLI